jgi:alcohol dehydrogenase class IV
MGIELCAKNLQQAVEVGSDLAARGAMMKAAMMGAVAFQKGLGVCHSLAHPLSSEKGLHHGLANALCLPAVVDFNNAVVPERIERVRRLVDLTATSLANALRTLREKVKLPGGLASEGVVKGDVPKLAEKALGDACHRSNPRPCTREDMVKLYEQSL